MSSTPAAACPNCGAPGAGPWCTSCGQEFPTPHGAIRRTVRRQWLRIAHSLTALVLHPGLLTAEFRDGMRARSINPWRLTLNIMAVFLALSFVTDFKVANFPNYDPSGTLNTMVVDAARASNMDVASFMERAERHFNTIFTLLIFVTVAITAVAARLLHWRRRMAWSVDIVFALHLTAWAFLLNIVYGALLRSAGASNYVTSGDTRVRLTGSAILAFVIVWQFIYITIAFRRVYGDGWGAAIGKAAVMSVLRFLAANLTISWAFLLAVKSVRWL